MGESRAPCARELKPWSVWQHYKRKGESRAPCARELKHHSDLPLRGGAGRAPRARVN